MDTCLRRYLRQTRRRLSPLSILQIYRLKRPHPERGSSGSLCGSKDEGEPPPPEEKPKTSPSPQTSPTLPRMLDWPTLVKAHALVPVWYWPVLWHYLARLEATAELARAEGRGGFGWELLKTGVIRVTHWPDSDAERAARGALPRSFDYTPWTRLDPDLASAGPLPDPYPAETPPIHRGCTLHAPPGAHLAARGPPRPSEKEQKPHGERSRTTRRALEHQPQNLGNQPPCPQAARPHALVSPAPSP